MPRASKKTALDPAAVYVCWQSGSVLTDSGEEVTFVRGQRLFGNAPQVAAASQFFVRDGDELPSAWDHVVARNEREQPPDEFDVVLVHEPTPLEAHEVRVLARAIVAAVGAGKDKQLVQLEKGQVFDARSELVTARPDLFEGSENGFTRPKGRRR